ncbi:hypothetical protein ACHAQA_009975 [Verticillium albo-atrum]
MDDKKHTQDPSKGGMTRKKRKLSVGAALLQEKVGHVGLKVLALENASKDEPCEPKPPPTPKLRPNTMEDLIKQVEEAMVDWSLPDSHREQLKASHVAEKGGKGGSRSSRR